MEHNIVVRSIIFDDYEFPSYLLLTWTRRGESNWENIGLGRVLVKNSKERQNYIGNDLRNMRISSLLIKHFVLSYFDNKHFVIPNTLCQIF